MRRLFFGLTWGLFGCAATLPAPQTRTLLVENLRMDPVRLRIQGTVLPWCEVPAGVTKLCSVSLMTDPPDGTVTVRMLNGKTTDSVPVILAPNARLRLDWSGQAYQPRPLLSPM